MDRDLSDHGAVSYDNGLSGVARDVGDVDLSDHGAVSYDNGPSGVARDVGDVDLSDHGAVSYDNGPSGVARDVGDVDLSDHGSIAYESKKSYWGTNDEEAIKNINMLMHASSCELLSEIIPHLNAESLATIVDYRYRQVASIINQDQNGLPKDDKETLGTKMCLDFRIIDNIISLNPNGLTAIFNPDLFMDAADNLTDIFGVLQQYLTDLDVFDFGIPLIDGASGEKIKTQEGKEITAQEIIQFLMSKKQTLENNNNEEKSL